MKTLDQEPITLNKIQKQEQRLEHQRGVGWQAKINILDQGNTILRKDQIL